MIDTCALKNKLLVSIFSGKLTTQKKSDSISSDLKESSNSLYELPFNWKWTSLKHVCSEAITDGTHQTPTYSISSDGIPFLSSKNVTLGHIDWTNIKYITKELHETLYKRIAPQIDDVLLAKNGTTGIAAIVENDRVFDIYVTLALLRPNKKYILPRYLLHVINSPVCKKQFNKRLIGIGVPNLHLNEINDTIIPLPPIEEQKCNIEKIESIFALLDEIDKAQEEYSKNKEVLISKIIDSLTFSTSESKKELLKNICQMTTGNSISENVKSTCYKDRNYPLPYIGTKDISFLHEINYSNGITIPENEDGFKKAPAQSVLLCVEGGSAGRKIAITDRTVCFGNKLCMFFSDKLCTKYLYYCLQNSAFKSLFKKGMTGLIGGVSQKALGNITINVPPIEEQKRIVEKLDAILPICGI